MSEVITPRARLSFPSLFKATKPKGAPAEQEPKFGATLLFDENADLSKLKKAAKDAAAEKWGDNIPKDLRTPFRDQGEKDYDGYEDGCIFITCTSKTRPSVVGPDKVTPVEEFEIYAGCYVHAAVRAFAYGGKGTGFRPGVSFGLQHIMKVADGEPLDGRTKPEDAFSEIETEVESTDEGDDIFG